MITITLASEDLGKLSIEDIVGEIDLPDDLTKLTTLQKQQIVNFHRTLEPKALRKRWVLLERLMAYNRQEIKNLKVLSNLIYAAKLQRPRGRKSE